MIAESKFYMVIRRLLSAFIALPVLEFSFLLESINQQCAPHNKYCATLQRQPPVSTLKCVITCSTLSQIRSWCLSRNGLAFLRVDAQEYPCTGTWCGCAHVRRDLMREIRSGFQLLQLIGTFST